MIHAFLDSLVEGYLASFLMLIISFLVLHILLSFIFRSRCLLSPSPSTLFKLRTVPRMAKRLSAQLINYTRQGQPFKQREPYLPFFQARKSISPPRLPSRHPLEFQGVVVFFCNHFALCKNQESEYQWSTYKDPILMVP
jgi:hypothetical protein